MTCGRSGDNLVDRRCITSHDIIAASDFKPECRWIPYELVTERWGWRSGDDDTAIGVTDVWGRAGSGGHVSGHSDIHSLTADDKIFHVKPNGIKGTRYASK
ncbi:hypothetical protein CBL_09419 [Carabus blaptoides fortunei]